MGNPYCEFLRGSIKEAAAELGLVMHATGTIVAVEGPRFGSKGESRMLRGFGGDLVNMTACPEVVLSAEAGLCYASVAMITDYDCWKEGEEEHASLELVMENMKVNRANVVELLGRVVEGLGKVDWVERSKEIRHQMATQNFLGR